MERFTSRVSKYAPNRIVVTALDGKLLDGSKDIGEDSRERPNFCSARLA